MSSKEWRIELPQSPTAARDARRIVREYLASWSLDGVVDDVLLLLSEVVTNAVHHGRSDIGVTLLVRHGVVRVEVWDASAAMPAQRAMSNDALQGRGLGIVAAVASRWGVEPVPGDGKKVWFEVTP